MCGKHGDVGEGDEDEHKSEEDGKVKNEAESDEDNLPLTQVFRLSTGGKVLVEGKKIIPLGFDIFPYPHCSNLIISLFHHSTI